MKAIPIRKFARPLLLAGGAALAAVLMVGAHSSAAREALLCSEAADVQFSPGGQYRAQKIEKACRWGYGSAQNHMVVSVEKQEKSGWTVVLPLEFDVRAHTFAAVPAMRWKNANTLEVTVYSSELTGTLVRRLDDLTITRRYVKSPKKGRAPADA